MSDLIEKYELFFRKTTRMFSKSIIRIMEDKRLTWKQKIKYMKDIDRYIDKAEKCEK